MRHVRAVVQGQQAVDSVRCEPDKMILADTDFLPVRATLNWTRMLFVPNEPVVPVDESVLRLQLNVTPGGTLTGQRIINARPLMLEIEGF